MLLNGGGEVVRGEAIPLYPLPLALLELVLVFLAPLFNLFRRIVFMRDACAGLKLLAFAQLGGLCPANGVGALGF